MNMSGFKMFPLLVTPCGRVLVGGNTIARFLASLRPESGLGGRTLVDVAEVNSFLDLMSKAFEEPLRAASSCSTETVSTAARERINVVLTELNSRLKNVTFLVGDRLSLADINLAVDINALVKHSSCGDGAAGGLLDSKPFVQNWPHVLRLYNTVFHHIPASILEPALVATGADAARCGAEIGSVDEKKKPAEKINTSATTAEAMEDDGAAKPKKENPLDLLPPAKMNLDEWKRVYSNTKDLYGVAMKWFWEHVDYEGYSFWKIRYDKLEDECTVSFHSLEELCIPCLDAYDFV
jgi:elongation factor 1-gamma